MFDRILIANRGEIACRVIRTAKRLGVHTVAVYSDADAHALHVALADEALHLGAAPALESYLHIERVIDAAQRARVEAIHPGYGFLSENARFAEACEAAGIVFIGPSAAAIRAMGDKSAAKEIMASAGVPLLPGYHGREQDADHLRAQADRIGYPILLKPAAGGGGKGMRIVRHAREFAEALDSARREAVNAFGDEVMLIEKYLEHPRHVEIQIFCDTLGGGVWLGERDCSIQRRHQKVIEEAPAPGMHPRLRQEMGKAALRSAQAIEYVGAGTVEFLLDADGTFHFMEMNTRLQVEHPVTEMTTGLDLVEWQLRVAAGEPLPLHQEEIALRGHSIEARIYAEDPAGGFLPQTGRLATLEPPVENERVRVDTGVVAGDEVTVHYDPLIAKLIVHDATRERALDRLADALANYRVGGIRTNIPFLYNLARSEAFRAARVDTRFIDQHPELLHTDVDVTMEEPLLLAALYFILTGLEPRDPAQAVDPWSPWDLRDAWRLNEPHHQLLQIDFEQMRHEVEVEHAREGYVIRTGTRSARCHGSIEGRRMVATVDGHRRAYIVSENGESLVLFTADRACPFALARPELGLDLDAEDAGTLVAPMHGTIVRLLVDVGERVEKNAPLLVMEAMKMEHTLRAPSSGRVTAFRCVAGERVTGGSILVEFEADEGGA